MGNSRLSAAHVIVVVLVLMLLPALYVASVGPVLLYDRTMNEGVTPRWIGVLYSPLFKLTEQNETAERAIDWYLELWGVWD
jgi:hypothetical protein